MLVLLLLRSISGNVSSSPTASFPDLYCLKEKKRKNPGINQSNGQYSICAKKRKKSKVKLPCSKEKRLPFGIYS